MRILLFAAAILCISGCCRTPLTCRSEYLFPDYLASSQVNTPDPLRCDYTGQQIVVTWDLPKMEAPLTLCLHVRYGNREVKTFFIPVKNRQDWWIYRLLNEDFVCMNGILAFKAELLQDDGLSIASWTHFLWADLITISPS